MPFGGASLHGRCVYQRLQPTYDNEHPTDRMTLDVPTRRVNASSSHRAEASFDDEPPASASSQMGLVSWQVEPAEDG